MDTFDAVPNPIEDLKHAHMLLEQMSPEELLKATYALEEIIEESPWFIEKMNKLNHEAEASRTVYMAPDMPMEDEDISAEEAESAARGRADLAAGRFCTLEELAQELGIPFTPVDQTPAVVSGER